MCVCVCVCSLKVCQPNSKHWTAVGLILSGFFSSIDGQEILGIYSVEMPTHIEDKVCNLGHLIRRCQKWGTFKKYKSGNCWKPWRIHDNLLLLSWLQIADACLQYAFPIHQLATFGAHWTRFVCLISFCYINWHPTLNLVTYVILI